MNRPEVRNALNPALIDELPAVLRGADADPEIRAIILTGAGTVFSAGLDLKAFTRGGGFDGLVWFYREGVLAEALALAHQIAGNAPLGVAVTKKLIRERRWGDPAEVETVFHSADAVEGARAFAERRPPVWRGK
jgi:enoyl-CoA hydratase/carnithine racemase